MSSPVRKVLRDSWQASRGDVKGKKKTGSGGDQLKTLDALSTRLESEHWVRTASDWAALPESVRTRVASELKIPAVAEAALLQAGTTPNQQPTVDQKEVRGTKRDAPDNVSADKSDRSDVATTDATVQRSRKRRKRGKKHGNQDQQNVESTKEQALPGQVDGSSVLFNVDLAATLRQDFSSTRNNPFGFGTIDGLLNEDLLQKVEAELSDLEFVRKSNDLYDFWQTRLDLGSVDTPSITAMRDILYSQDLRKTLGRATGAKNLRGTPDIFCARYGDGSTLLAHDDDESDRRIAFILYLVPDDWNTDVDGGALALFQSDQNGEPRSIHTIIEPKRNRLVFFEVNERSWHQVCEVLTAARERMSVSGWWRGPIPAEVSKNRSALRARSEKALTDAYQSSFLAVGAIQPVAEAKKHNLEIVLESDDDDIDGSKGAAKKKKTIPREAIKESAKLLKRWVNPMYLQSKTQAQIREQFEAEASVSLTGFFKEECYAELLDVIESHNWELHGPLHRRHYQRILFSPNARNKGRRGSRGTGRRRVRREVAEVAQLLLSAEFAALIQKLTGADVDEVSHEIRRFSQGTYTLAQDRVTDVSALDCIFACVTGPELPTEHGGQLVYLNEEEELLTVPAQANTLTLCMRDPGVMRFVKYLNHHAKDLRYDFALEFRGPAFNEASDQSGEESSGSSSSSSSAADEDASTPASSSESS